MRKIISQQESEVSVEFKKFQSPDWFGNEKI